MTRPFLDYIKDHDTWGRYHSIFAVLVGTGLRASELSGLRWEDVDLDKRVINVNHALVRITAMNGIKGLFRQQYDSLQREIVETEQKLKGLEEQASKQMLIRRMRCRNMPLLIVSQGDYLRRRERLQVSE